MLKIRASQKRAAKRKERNRDICRNQTHLDILRNVRYQVCDSMSEISSGSLATPTGTATKHEASGATKNINRNTNHTHHKTNSPPSSVPSFEARSYQRRTNCQKIASEALLLSEVYLIFSSKEAKIKSCERRHLDDPRTLKSPKRAPLL